MTKEELIGYIETAPAQQVPFTIMDGTKVIDYRLFVDTHISNLKLDRNDMNSPVALRLLALKAYIENKTK